MARESAVGTYLKTIVAALLIALFVRTYIAQAYNIPSGSMKNTLLIGDHVLVEKVTPWLWTPERGDIVVFHSPVESATLIKRVIGMPGERLEIVDDTVFVNGKPLDEPYAFFEESPFTFPGEHNAGAIDISEGQVFLMGDNRNNSGDSRVFGPIDVRQLIGKALIVHWSWNQDASRVRWGRLGTVLK